jgi:hypothetical protein
MYLITIKALCNKPTVILILNEEKLRIFPLGPGIRKEPYLHYFCHYRAENPSQVRERKRVSKLG